MSGIAHLAAGLTAKPLTPKLALFFAGTPSLGLGLENSGAGLVFMTILDLVLLGGGIAMYLRSRRRRITRLHA